MKNQVVFNSTRRLVRNNLPFFFTHADYDELKTTYGGRVLSFKTARQYMIKIGTDKNNKPLYAFRS